MPADNLLIGNPGNTDRFNIRVVETEKRRPNHRMMRSGRAQDAMSATAMFGAAGGQLRSVLAPVDTKLETRGVVSGMCRE